MSPPPRSYPAARSPATPTRSSGRTGSERTRPVVVLASTAAALSFLVYFWFFRPVGGGIDAVGYVLGRDFLSMWAAPRVAASSGVNVLTDLPAFSAAMSRSVGLPGISAMWTYPPTALLLLVPFSLASYWASLALWTFSGWSVYLASALALRRSRPHHSKLRASTLGLLAASPAAWINAGTGQNGSILAALLFGGFAALRARPRLAGVLFGLMTFKPHVGVAVAVALVAIGAWRAVAAASATALLLGAAASWVYGFDVWRDYATLAMPFNMRVLAAPASGHRLLLASLTAALTQAGLALAWASTLQALVAAATLAVLWAAARRTVDPLRLLTLVAAATPLVTPYLWTYDLVALCAALALRFAEAPGRCPRWILAMGYLSPALSVLLQVFPGVATAPWLIAPAFAAAAIEAVSGTEATAQCRRSPAARGAAPAASCA